MILNSSETSGPLSNGRVLKMCSLEVYIKSFGGQKGGSLEPPRTPPAYGPGLSMHLTLLLLPLRFTVFFADHQGSSQSDHRTNTNLIWLL